MSQHNTQDKVAFALDMLREAASEIPAPRFAGEPEGREEIRNGMALRLLNEAMAQCIDAMEVLAG